MNALLSSPVLSWLLSYLFNALWQIPLIFAAAWIAARMLRGAHPGFGHRVWVGALLLQVTLPACALRFDPLWHALLGLFPTTSTPDAGGVRVAFGSIAATGGTLRLPFAFETAVIFVWACCLLYFAVRLVWGLHQTRILARSASRITLTGDTALAWTGHCHRLGITAPSPEVAASPQGIGPLTVGLRRGLLLLPPTFLESIVPGDRDAVLAHELAHIHRYDFAKNLLYGLISLPIAWHPIMWRTRARIAESRELVCDAMAAEAVAGRKQYAQSLLRIASMFSGGPPVPTLHALGILSLSPDVRIFERRIMSLTHKRTPMSAARRILVAASCCVLALATCASALALHTDISATTPGAETQASGPGTPKTIHVKGRIMQGQKITGDNPVYPPEARAKKIEGAVVIDATIGKDGAIENLQVMKSPDKRLSASALEAVRTWRYRPYLLNGDPVEVETTINVVYNLEG